MSEEKRQQLIESGALNPDGSRKERCPTCSTAVGETLTQEAYNERCAPGAGEGAAVGEVETVAAEGVSPGGAEQEASTQ